MEKDTLIIKFTYEGYGKDFKKQAQKLKSKLYDLSFQEIDVEEAWISCISWDNVLKIYKSGLINYTFFDIDLMDKEMLYPIVEKLNMARSIIKDTFGMDLSTVFIMRLDFEYPNNNEEMLQKFQNVVNILQGIKVSSIDIKQLDKLGGACKVVEAIASY